MGPGQIMAGRFAVSFDATELAARDGICAVTGQLQAMGLPAAALSDVQIALAESVNNIVEHGYDDASPGRIDLACALSGGRLDLEICDQGRPMPGGTPPEGSAPRLCAARDDLPEGGFGWFLIRQLASSVDYSRRQGRNRLLLGFDVPTTGR